MDVSRDEEVWNQPVYKYEVNIEAEQPPSDGAAPGTVKEVLVRNQVTYSLESVSQWNPVIGTDYNNFNAMEYNYRLELNSQGEILGGEWLDIPRPDFVWIKGPPVFHGSFSSLKAIYELSLKSAGIPNPAAEFPVPDIE
jgi:hypothetical protein